MTPLILDIEEDQEDTEQHGEDDADHHQEPTVHPAASPQVLTFHTQHVWKSSQYLLPLIFPFSVGVTPSDTILYW